MRTALFLSMILFVAVVNAQTDNKFGEEIALTEKTMISDILSEPDKYLGERVLVEGKILDVCAAAGCWMDLSSESGDRKIKIKVRDGEIVFPVEAKGKTALVEGEVYSIELNEEQAKAFMKHMAEDAGKEFDESTVKGPMTVYQIKGIGAVISTSDEE